MSFRSAIKFFCKVGLLLAFTGGIVVVVGYVTLEAQLPDISLLEDVQMQEPLRIYSRDSKLIGEFGAKRRIPVKFEDIPPHLVQAVLSIEDRRFYEHEGVDIIGLGRAVVNLLLTGRKSQGGSTITMQVARNFFLTRHKTYTRKVKEILLAIKIDQKLSKEKILELYLNKIYLGNGAYGVAAAAKVYYGRDLQTLTLSEMAMLAGLPKAPSRLNPIANPIAAKRRRNLVLQQMMDEKYITQSEYQEAIEAPVTARYHGRRSELHAPFIAEMIRDRLKKQFGKKIYTQGLHVYTTIDSTLQNASDAAVKMGLEAYDRRHGYRGPVTNLGFYNEDNRNIWLETLSQLHDPTGLLPAGVTAVEADKAQILFSDGATAILPWAHFSWARPALQQAHMGPIPQKPEDVLKEGDIIFVKSDEQGLWLAQTPEVQGALIALDPHDGAIRAMTGGYHFALSKFNRAVQAQRQTGSNFKPFIYAAALAKNYTLATIINDAPVVVDDPSADDMWRPKNDSRHFYGPTRLRVGLTKSRNLVSIRLLQRIGIPYTRDYLTRFGFPREKLPNSLSLALGTGTTTPLAITSAYATFANGGFRVKPYLIEHIETAQNPGFYDAKPLVACDDCALSVPPEQQAPAVITPQVAYLIRSAMQDVIQKGTGRRARVLKCHDISGKTGTTNEQMDAWFSGFNRDIVATAWVGFDKPRTLGEYGSKAALPIWIKFMEVALSDKAERPLPRPPGLITVRIDPKTGLYSKENLQGTIFETFRKGNIPQAHVHAGAADKQYEPGFQQSYDPLYEELF